jgi:hypothetical protein
MPFQKHGFYAISEYELPSGSFIEEILRVHTKTGEVWSFRPANDSAIGFWAVTELALHGSKYGEIGWTLYQVSQEVYVLVNENEEPISHKKLGSLRSRRCRFVMRAEQLSPREAAEWLIKYDYELPAELKHLEREILSNIPPALPAFEKPPAKLEEDDTAYVAARTFLKRDGFPKYLSEITASLKVNTWIRWKRPVSKKTGREIPNRLLIHAGDWHKFEQQKQSMVDPFEQNLSLVEATLEEIEARKNLEKARKAVGRSQN